MKNLMKNYWVMLIALFMLSTSAIGQISTPKETKDQAEAEMWNEQKNERARQRRVEKATNQQLNGVNHKPQYGKIVKKREKVLLKPIVTREKKK